MSPVSANKQPNRKTMIRTQMRRLLVGHDANKKVQRNACSIPHGFLRLLYSLPYGYSDCILAFFPMFTEPPIHELLLHALRDKKKVCVPMPDSVPYRIREVTEFTSRYIPHTMYLSRTAIPIPLGFNFCARYDFSIQHILSTQMQTIVLVPGLAFSAKGARLGKGGGYYDKLFSYCARRTGIVKIGVCRDFQILEDDEIPMESHDVRMDYVLSDRGLLRTGCL